MSGLIPQNFIDDLLSRLDIVRVIDGRVPLKKSGSRYTACCPFHQEKTPSFHVVPDKQFYHCFGCGAHGDAISFVREFDGLGFNDSVEELARIAGVEVPRDENAKKQHDQRKHLLEAVAVAGKFYRQQLLSHPDRETAIDYLLGRGLEQETIDRFEIGFAPYGKSNLSEAVDSKTRKALVETRLVSDKYQTPFDLFQNRIMFPIRDTRGRTIAFGGRTLGNDKSKYINSPESAVFHKSHEIYGLYEAYKACRKIDQLLVVEGYMDVVSLAQHGINYAVATLGTATNSDNLTSLLKHSKKLIFCFDGDRAGNEAAAKAMNNALPLLRDGIDIKFLLLPEGEDPDTLVRKEGHQAFQQRIESAQHLSTFFFEVHQQGLDMTVPEHRGILKSRAEKDLDQVGSKTIQRALRDQLYKLVNPFQRSFSKTDKNFRQKKPYSNFQKPTMQMASAPPSPIKYRYGIKLALSAYYDPGKAAEYLARIQSGTETDTLEEVIEFLRFISESGAKDTKGLITSLAVNPEACQRFGPLFDSLEHFATEEITHQEARDELNRLTSQIRDQRLESLSQKARTEQGLSDDEKQELQKLLKNGAN